MNSILVNILNDLNMETKVCYQNPTAEQSGLSAFFAVPFRKYSGIL